MFHIIKNWYEEYFSDPQVAILALLLIAGFAVVITFGDMLAPVLASIIIAYLLEGGVVQLERRHVPRILAVILVFIAFMTFLVFLLLGLLPLLSRQATQLIGELPNMLAKGQELLMRLPERYPEFFSQEQVQELGAAIRVELGELGKRVVSMSVSSVMGVITLLVYLILMPLLVFFFMKDKHRILGWLTAYMPRDSALATEVWREVDSQIGNYVRGKFWEILIVWWVTYIVFSVLGLNFAMLLSALVGISVIVPFIGAAVVTIPVAAVAYFQWGVTPDFWILVAAYLVIQALDGNALVPLLFSEVVDLHPIAIIVAVLVFGGVWGFWGVFFAIPLATLVQAVLKAWPRRSRWALARLPSGSQAESQAESEREKRTGSG
ncbi:MAG: AI-2E family transporter [Gammaproteobacteria bacterium]|nr:AI-2E family transporter [Gammaproteobacteria bacterium]NIR84095.1 AI-2E family transporter [Gammaproteobacteria bacterium]NIR89239.1 AI-2E family transporter [Gammaproteobacteria bacterium]NIU05041.1 AI-2E family transporter [Gammaproteobacteria bacterium]NIV52207.1 AI-2E family transporter [Gammaproteobacteria bacterium]